MPQQKTRTRNREILHLALSDDSMTSDVIADKFNLSKSRIYEVVAGEFRRQTQYLSGPGYEWLIPIERLTTFRDILGDRQMSLALIEQSFTVVFNEQAWEYQMVELGGKMRNDVLGQYGRFGWEAYAVEYGYSTILHHRRLSDGRFVEYDAPMSRYHLKRHPITRILWPWE